MKIALDAMGGDCAPKEIVEGAILCAREGKKDLEIILVGDPERIQSILDKHDAGHLNLSIHPASEVIHMNESPVDGLRKKKDASIARAVELVKKGQAEAVVSAGNTGACVAAAKLKLRFLAGVDRPGIAAMMPNMAGEYNILIDAGATVDCSTEHLLCFAIMGHIYAKFALKKDLPKVGILNVGEEDVKGNDLTKKTFRTMRELPINFIGNVEGRDIFRSVADVIVADGFVGNVALKSSEGGGRLLMSIIKKEIYKSFFTKMGALLMRPAFDSLKKVADYAERGGAPLLGVNGICIICHGRSTAKAIKNAILVAEGLVQCKLNMHIEEEIGKVQNILQNIDRKTPTSSA
ncbi:MAG: phosphate acyltransferase PlsX [Chlamydiota bacterium]|nr:phosphate acyltransferase PlsX [Chlamydiota bacterium]